MRNIRLDLDMRWESIMLSFAPLTDRIFMAQTRPLIIRNKIDAFNSADMPKYTIKVEGATMDVWLVTVKYKDKVREKLQSIYGYDFELVGD